MTPEQHQIYLRTYELAVAKFLSTCSDEKFAAEQASTLAHYAVKLYDTIPAKPGRPKESK